MKKICYIVGASGEGFKPFSPKDGDLLIACDGGYYELIKNGYTPDILIGDLDSLPQTDISCKLIKHPVMKDDTDMMLCIKHGIENGYKDFVIFCGVGGERFSHTYANIQSLTYLLDNDCFGKLIFDNGEMFMLKNGAVEFDENAKGDISVFAYSDVCTGVTEKGLKYSLDDAEMTNRFPIGVSNSFTGKPANITVKDGTLLIILEN